MKLIALNLTNFGSYVGSQTLYFPDGPGLYFMHGENRDQPRLEGNGTGKSTVWKALCWLFFDKTPAGLRAGDVSSWSVGKKTSVTLTFQREADLPEFITRTWAPNSWKWTDLFGAEHDLAKDASNVMSDILRMDMAAFLQSIVMPQDEVLFLELPGTKQAEIFSNVMNLDRWLNYSARASDRARTEDMEVRRLEREMARIDGSMSSARIDDILKQQTQWERDRDKRIDTLLDEHRRLMKQHEGLKEKQGMAKEAREIAADALAMSQDEVNELTAELDDDRDNLRDDEAVWRQAVADLKARRDVLSKLENADTCPLCGHDVDDASPGLQRLQNDVSNADKKVVTATSSLDSREAACKKTASALAQVAAIQEDLKREVQDTDAAARKLERELAALDQSLDRIEDDAEQLERAVSPFASLLQSERRAQTDLAEARHGVIRRLDEAQTRFSMASYWVRWFKDIRLEQIGGALTQLDLEVNNQIAALGLLDWGISFEVDKQTKSGTVQRGFTVDVLSPNNARPVPWDSWSGGEKQRLIVAGQMGLADLIRARTGTLLNLEVWDEPTKGMSPQGVQDLLEALHARAHREGRQIWVVDHNTLGFNKFDGAVKVLKTADGSVFTASPV